MTPTHTTRHLAAYLAAHAHHHLPPAGVVVTCDTDDPAIGALLDAWWPRVAAALEARTGQRVPLIHTWRPHQGRAQLNQVRNNGLRALRDVLGMQPEDLVVVVDGDTMLMPESLARHQALRASGHDLIIPYRYELDEGPTRTVDAEAVLAGGVDRALITPGLVEGLARRDRRYRKHLLFNTLRLDRLATSRPHKPKLIGGHHAVSWRTLVEVNGFDEEYVGYRFNDDDLSRRLRALRPKTAIAVRAIEAVHLWHPIRAPDRLQDAPGYQRWIRTDLPTRCVVGLDNPLAQPTPQVRVIR
jgi:hypothetical protein